MEEKRPLILNTLKCTVVKCDNGFLSVPVFLVDAFNLLRFGGIKNEGIFRKPGNEKRVQSMNYPFFGEFGLPEGSTAFDVAHLIKKFFRDLHEPLLTETLEHQFLESYVVTNEKVRIRYVLELCHILPPRHRETLAYLMRQLKNIARYSQYNKMDAKNLAIVFAPSIFRHNNAAATVGEHCEPAILHEEMQKRKRENDLKTFLLEVLIENAENICVLSEYEKVMSPDMYDKLLPEDRRNANGRNGRQVKSQTFAVRDECSTPVTTKSKSKSSLMKRKSDCGGDTPNKIKDSGPANDQARETSARLVRSPNKHRSSYTTTMKNVSQMARRELDLKVKPNDWRAKKPRNKNEDDGDGSNGLNRSKTVNDGERRSLFKRNRSYNFLKPTEGVEETTECRRSVELIISDVVKQVCSPEQYKKDSIEVDVILNGRKEDDELGNNSQTGETKELNHQPLNNEKWKPEEEEGQTDDPNNKCIQVHVPNLAPPATSTVVFRSSSDSSVVVGKTATVQTPSVKPTRNTSPRKKLRRNAAVIRTNQRKTNSSRKSPRAVRRPVTPKLTEKTVEKLESPDMDFENSDARKEVLLNQVENTETIIDVQPPPINSALEVPQIQFVESPAAAHRPSVAYIVKERRGIVRQHTEKFEQLARNSQDVVVVPAVKSPVKTVVPKCISTEKLPKSNDNIAPVSTEKLNSSAVQGLEQEKDDSNEAVELKFPKNSVRLRPRKSLADLVRSTTDSPKISNNTPKIQKPLKRLTKDSSSFGKSAAKKYPNSPRSPLGKSKIHLSSSYCENI